MPIPRKTLIPLTVATLLLPLPALAYIDPNTGGMLFQMLAPLLAAVVGAWALLRQRIGMFFQRFKRKADKQHPDDPPLDDKSGD